MKARHWFAVSFAAALSACGASQHQAANTPTAAKASVPSGTPFRVRLDKALGSQTSQTGESFSATLARPLVAPNGQVVVPAGAKLRGRVVQVHRTPAAGLMLDFEAIQTNKGPILIDATAPASQSVGSITGIPIYQRAMAYEAVLVPRPEKKPSAIGGGPATSHEAEGQRTPHVTAKPHAAAKPHEAAKPHAAAKPHEAAKPGAVGGGPATSHEARRTPHPAARPVAVPAGAVIDLILTNDLGPEGPVRP